MLGDNHIAMRMKKLLLCAVCLQGSLWPAMACPVITWYNGACCVSHSVQTTCRTTCGLLGHVQSLGDAGHEVLHRPVRVVEGSAQSAHHVFPREAHLADLHSTTSGVPSGKLQLESPEVQQPHEDVYWCSTGNHISICGCYSLG